MRHEMQVETMRALLKQRAIDRDQVTIDEPVKIPTDIYLDNDIFAREMETVFKDNLLVAGHADQVTNPGDYILSEWDRLPYVIVRGQDGVLRGFLNVCSHRGARLVSGEEENLKSFVCPYHGWYYGLDGSLKGVTKAYNFPDLDCDKHGLQELPVVERHGLVWVHPTPGTDVDIEKFIGPEIDSDMEHFRLNDLNLHRSKKMTLNANWKLLLKTYLDRYHVPVLHKNSIAPFFQSGVIVDYEFGPHIRISAGLTNLPEAADEQPEDWKILKYASVLYTMFPNTYLINHSDLVSINRFYPISTGETVWIHDMYYRKGHYEGEEAQEALATRFANIDAVFGYEDFGIAESCQKMLPFSKGHNLGLEEGLLAYFQQSIDDAVSAT